MRKRIWGMLLAISLSLSFASIILPKNAYAAAISAQEMKEKLDTLRNTSGFRNGDTNYGNYHNASQCMGFAVEVCYRLFNEDCRSFYVHRNIDNLCVGDHVRFRSDGWDHSIVVTNISGETVYYVDCNGAGGSNKVCWTNTTKSDLRNKIAQAIYETTNRKGNGYGYIETQKDNWVKTLDSVGSNSLGTPVNVGDDFYALIINTKAWMPIHVNDDDNVILATENHLQNQMWHFQRLSDGSYKIISLKNGKVLDVHNAGTTNGTNIKVCDANSGTAQKWYIYGTSNNYKLKAQNTNCVMDVKDGNLSSGSNIQTYEFNNSVAQNFQIYILEPNIALGYAVNIGDEFYARIKSTGTALCLTSESNDNVAIRKSTNTYNQIWYFTANSDGSYKIKSVSCGKLLDVHNEGTANGTNIKVYQQNSSTAQKWNVYGYKDRYKLKAQITNCVMDIADGKIEDGRNVQTWQYNDTIAQHFYIEKLSTYTLSYNSNNGANVPVKQTKIQNANLTLSAQQPTRTGYTFKNWNTSVSGTGKSYAPGATYSENANLTLYAQWTPNTYKVNFNANGGSISSNTKNVTYNSAYGDLPTPTRNGYKFIGWFTSQSGGIQITKSTTVTTTSNLTLYAQWEATKIYTKSTVSKNNNNYTVKTNIYNTTSCEIIVAGYKNGRLVDLKVNPYSESSSAVLTGDIDEIKVMLWETLKNMQPLSEAEVIAVTQ